MTETEPATSPRRIEVGQHTKPSFPLLDAHREAVMPLDHGVIRFSWPRIMSHGDYETMRDWLSLMTEKIMRTKAAAGMTRIEIAAKEDGPLVFLGTHLEDGSFVKAGDPLPEDRPNPARAISDDMDNRFTHHPPDNAARVRHERVRNDCQHLAATLLALVPPGRERSVAITKIEEAMFWANAGIARAPTRAAKGEPCEPS